MRTPSNEPEDRGRIATGEPFIWLTGMGLTIGLGMIICLLALIVWEGVRVFWPARLVQVALRAESTSARRGRATEVAGEIRMRQLKVQRELDAEVGEKWEWQLFVGNREVNGFSFLFIDRDHIVAQSRPLDLMRIERLEFGDAVGVPVAVQLRSGQRLAADDPRFESVLRQVAMAAAARRGEIKRIEKDEIGKINQRMLQYQLRQKAEGIEPDRDLSPETPYQAQLNSLEVEYEVLAAQARELREQQQQDVLHYRLVDGREQELPTGEIFHYYFPNRIGVWQRTGLFVRNIWRFVVDEPREANTEGGIFPAIFGTFVMTLMMTLMVTPFGVLGAIYLHEYARQGLMVRTVRVAINNLAGVPSIVFGVFGLGFFVYFVGGTVDDLFFSLKLPTPTFGTGGMLWASLTLALLTVPVVIVATEEALSAVPRGVREGSLACGASKWQTIQRVVLPAAAPGIMTGTILAMARGAGEVAPLMLVGVVKVAPSLPLNLTYPFLHLDQKFMHLGFHIYDLGFQSPDSEAAKPMVFATTLLLIMLVVSLNLTGIIVRNRLRKKLLRSAF